MQQAIKPMIGMAVQLIRWIGINVYLVTLVVVKNAAVVQNTYWQKFTTGTKIGHSFKYKKNYLIKDVKSYGLALEF